MLILKLKSKSYSANGRRKKNTNTYNSRNINCTCLLHFIREYKHKSEHHLYSGKFVNVTQAGNVDFLYFFYTETLLCEWIDLNLHTQACMFEEKKRAKESTHI